MARCLEGEFLAPALRKALDASALTGADRSLVTELSYGAVRRLLQLDAALDPYLRTPGKLPPRVLVALRLAAYELLFRGTASYAVVSSWVEIVKREARGLAGLANAVLRKVARAAETAQADAPANAPAQTDTPANTPAQTDPERELALPAWLWRELVASLGEGAARRAALGMLEPEPLWLTAFAERAEAVLVAQGCEVRAGPEFGSLRSLAVRSPLPLDRLDAYRQGLVQPQNPSSRYAAELLGVAGAQLGSTTDRDLTTKPGRGESPSEVIFDLASGQGVKTAVLAAIASARIVAVERSARRTRAAQANLRRLGLSEVEHLVADLVTTPPEELLARAGGQSGRVLLDAPCSGTGTLRGHPEIKLRLAASDVAELAATQSRMLDTAAALVAPGGRLLYAVCSLLPAEGPEQLGAFLQRHDGFRPLPLAPPLPHEASGEGVFLLPVDALDGFFLGLLERA